MLHYEYGWVSQFSHSQTPNAAFVVTHLISLGTIYWNVIKDKALQQNVMMLYAKWCITHYLQMILVVVGRQDVAVATKQDQEMFTSPISSAVCLPTLTYRYEALYNRLSSLKRQVIQVQHLKLERWRRTNDITSMCPAQAAFFIRSWLRLWVFGQLLAFKCSTS